MAKPEELLNSQIVVAAFNDESTADQAMQALKAASKEQDFQIQDIAVVRRDENNKIHIKETGDIGGGKGAVLGGIAGGIVGLIAGPLAIVTSAIGGALVGGLVAKFWDTGIKNETLQSLGNALQPGTSAIVAVLGNQKVSQLRAMMEQVGGNVMVANMTADIANAVASGQDVAMSVGATNDTLSATRVVADATSVEYRGMVATAEGVYVEGVQATQEGIVAGAAVITSAGDVIGEIAAATAEKASDTADAASEAASTAVESAGDAAEAAGEAASNATEAAGEAVNDAAASAGEAVSDATDAASEAVDKA